MVNISWTISLFFFQNKKTIISVRRVTVDAGYVMTVTKKVPIMDIINGLKKRIISEH